MWDKTPRLCNNNNDDDNFSPRSIVYEIFDIGGMSMVFISQSKEKIWFNL